jgi:hypothetical protein
MENINASSIVALSFMRQLLLDIRRQVNPGTVTVGNFSTLFSPIARSSRLKNIVVKLHVDPLDLMYIHRRVCTSVA